MNPNNPTYQCIIFDLGNVLFYIDFNRTWQYWANVIGIPVSKMPKPNLSDKTAIQFEKGLISGTEFWQYVNKNMEHQLSFEQFCEGWNNLYLAHLPGILDLIKILEKKYRLVVLSNTNSIHQKAWQPLYADALTHFEKLFLSHEIHAAKPEAKAYQTVLDYLQIAPEKALFLDDRSENIEGANALGITGIVVQSPQQLQADLLALGVINRAYLPV